MSRDWDANTYHQVSTPHQQWSVELIRRLALTGSETVLDAGCGSGAVTAQLLEAVPAGKVYAVDVAPSMVAHTRETLGDRGVEVLQQDLTELALPEPVEAIFSSATFHWIPNHDKLFAALFAALAPGGRIVAQCGGYGNIDAFRLLADQVAFEDERFAPYFADWTRPWNYATAEETATRLTDAGFVDVETWLVDMPTPIEDAPTYARTIVLVRHVDVLPPELRDAFVDRVLELYPKPFVLDYVRLNLVATKPTKPVHLP
jgi:trans-aconitate 2-methyltransferase